MYRCFCWSTLSLFLLVDVTENVVLRVAQYLHRHGVVVVLQRRYVVVAQCQLRLRVYLIPVNISHVRQGSFTPHGTASGPNEP